MQLNLSPDPDIQQALIFPEVINRSPKLLLGINTDAPTIEVELIENY